MRRQCRFNDCRQYVCKSYNFVVSTPVCMLLRNFHRAVRCFGDSGLRRGDNWAKWFVKRVLYCSSYRFIALTCTLWVWLLLGCMFRINLAISRFLLSVYANLWDRIFRASFVFFRVYIISDFPILPVKPFCFYSGLYKYAFWWPLRWGFTPGPGTFFLFNFFSSPVLLLFSPWSFLAYRVLLYFRPKWHISKWEAYFFLFFFKCFHLLAEHGVEEVLLIVFRNLYFTRTIKYSSISSWLKVEQKIASAMDDNRVSTLTNMVHWVTCPTFSGS